MKIVHDRTAGTITISQTKYIEDLLVKFDMVNANPTKTPAEPGSKLKKTTLPPDSVNFPYRELVGNLLWLARTSRPDILYAVGQLCAHVLNFDSSHVTAAKRVLRYLKGTKELPLVFRRNVNGEFVFELMADADFAGEPEENDGAMRSLSGNFHYVRGVGPIHCVSSLQSTVATSTSDAETKTVGTGVQFLLGFIQLLSEIGFAPTLPVTVYNDNEACITAFKSKLSGSKLRHVKVNFHFVKERIDSGEIKLQYLPTRKMIADIFTKALPAPRFIELRGFLLNGCEDDSGSFSSEAKSIRSGGVSG